MKEENEKYWFDQDKMALIKRLTKMKTERRVHKIKEFLRGMIHERSAGLCDNPYTEKNLWEAVRVYLPELDVINGQIIDGLNRASLLAINEESKQRFEYLKDIFPGFRDGIVHSMSITQSLIDKYFENPKDVEAPMSPMELKNTVNSIIARAGRRRLKRRGGDEGNL